MENRKGKDLSAALDLAEASLLDPGMDFSTLPTDDELLNYFLSTEMIADRERFGSLDMADLLNDDILDSLPTAVPPMPKEERHKDERKGLIIKSEDLTSFANIPPLADNPVSRLSKENEHSLYIVSPYPQLLT